METNNQYFKRDLSWLSFNYRVLQEAANDSVPIIGGEPLPEERLIYWNFVASEQSVIDKAKTKWLEQKFPLVKGETEFVPLPPERHV